MDILKKNCKNSENCDTRVNDNLNLSIDNAFLKKFESISNKTVASTKNVISLESQDIVNKNSIILELINDFSKFEKKKEYLSIFKNHELNELKSLIKDQMDTIYSVCQMLTLSYQTCVTY